MFEQEAKGRQVSTLKQNRSGKIALTDPGQARDHAAKATGASARYISDAKAIQKRAPELIDDVKSGALTIPEAKRVSVLRPGVSSADPDPAHPVTVARRRS